MESVRIDKFLWAARFYKTRQLAIKALKNSQVLANRQNLKPASQVKAGDVLKIKRGIHELEIEILVLSEQRGPAKVAQTLYQETNASIENREKLQQQLARQPKIDFDRRKPERRDIRSNRAIKRGE